MTVEHVCAVCEQPCDESEFVCSRCGSAVARFLADAVALSGEVETTVAFQSRYSATGAARAPDPIPADATDAQRPLQRAETFGWAASRELPVRGALRPTRLPFNERAAERAAVAFNALTTWARVINDDRGGFWLDPIHRPLCERACPHDTCNTIRWEATAHPAALAARFLTDNLDRIRKQRFAAECLADLRQAGGTIRQIVDRPPDQRIAGICECRTVLYAYANAQTVTCPDCGSHWDVETSRQNLWDALPGYLMTASESALLLMLHGIGNQDRRRWAKTITMWAQRSLITPHGEVDGAPLYLFGDVLERATRKGAAA